MISRRRPRGRVRAWAAVALAIALGIALAGQLAGSPGGAAAAAARPASARPHPATLNPAHLPAASGPAVAPPPSSITAAAATACAAQAWRAGFSYTSLIKNYYRQIVVAVGVELAESGCNPKAAYVGPKCSDRGLWQIDSCAWPQVADSCAYAAQCNAIAAYIISADGSNWSPWPTFTRGTWLKYLTLARTAVREFTVLLRDRGSGTCLGVAAAGGSGAPVIQSSCGSSPAAQWNVIAGINGANPVLQNAGSGACLTAAAGAAGVVQAPCDPVNHYQRWSIQGSATSAGWGALSATANAAVPNAGARTCLSADAANAVSGGPIVQSACSAGNRYQQWS